MEHRTDSPVGLCDAQQRSVQHVSCHLSLKSVSPTPAQLLTADGFNTISSGVHGAGVGGKC